MDERETHKAKRKVEIGDGNGRGPQELVPSATPEDSADTSVDSDPALESATSRAELQEPASIEEQLAQAQKQAAEYLEMAQRARADLVNFKRRVEREKEEGRRFAVEGLIVDLLPVMDSFNQALDSFADESDDGNPLLAGLRRTAAQFERVLAKYDVARISKCDVPFDAELHQPLHTEESEDVDAETVAEVYQPGVRIGERVIRPASVKVLVPKAEQNESCRKEEGEAAANE